MEAFLYGCLLGVPIGLLLIAAWLLFRAACDELGSRRRAHAYLAQVAPRPLAATGPTTRLAGCAHDYPAGAAYCIECGRPR